MRALLPSCFEQEFGYGDVVGHDGDVQRCQAFTVGSVEVQFISCVLEQQDLYGIQVLLFDSLEQSLTALNVLWGEETGEGKLRHLWYS